MTDVVDPATRSRIMSRIKGKNTKPEMLIRKTLYGLGYRYRLHESSIMGKPDMVFRSRNALVFVNGCFWHGHDCHLFRLPSSRQEWWRDKIQRNRDRDHLVKTTLADQGWRQAHIWECALKGKAKVDFRDMIDSLVNWLDSNVESFEVVGRSDD